MMTSSERFHIACLYFATSESQEPDFLQIEFSFRHLTDKKIRKEGIRSSTSMIHLKQSWKS